MAAVALPPNIVHEASTFGEKVQRLFQEDEDAPAGSYRQGTLTFTDGCLVGYCCTGGCRGGRNDGKACLLLIAITAVFASVIMIASGVLSFIKSINYSAHEQEARNKFNALLPGSRDNDAGQLYSHTITLLSEKKSSGYASSLSLVTLGSGLGMLTVALIIAFAVNRTPPGYAIDMMYYGGGAAGAGLLGYTVSYGYYANMQRPKIKEAHNGMNQALRELQYKQHCPPPYSELPPN